jgi:hypothetical protein
MKRAPAPWLAERQAKESPHLNSIEHEAEDYSASRVVEESIRIIGRVFW